MDGRQNVVMLLPVKLFELIGLSVFLAMKCPQTLSQTI